MQRASFHILIKLCFVFGCRHEIGRPAFNRDGFWQERVSEGNKGKEIRSECTELVIVMNHGV